MRGVDIGDAFFVKQGDSSAGFHFALLDGGVTAVGLALIADGGQAFRVYDQAEELLFVLLECIGQAQVVEVIFSQGVVPHLYAELQGHIKGGRGFPGAGHAGQDDVGLVVMAGAGTIVIVQCKVHGFDPDVIGLVVDDGVGLANGIDRTGAELGSQLAHEGLKDIQHIAIGLGDDITDILVDDGVNDDRPGACGLGNLVDLVYGGPGLFHVVHIRNGQLLELDILKLGQQAVSQCFGGNAGAIGNEKDATFHQGHPGCALKGSGGGSFGASIS